MLWTLISLLALNIPPIANGTPDRQPQLASGYGMIALTFASGSSIYFAGSNDNGRTFSTPVLVEQTAVLAMGRHRGPRAIILKDAMVISAVAGVKTSTGPHAHGLPDDGDLVTWRSIDRGKTWSRAGIVNDVPGAAREGLHAMIADGRGGLFAVWLDLRSKGTKLYGSRSTDGGVTWSKNVLVYSSPDGSICECCAPSLALDVDGKIAIMWRNSLAGSRDLYLTSTEDGAKFTTPVKLGTSTWKLNACPMDGGGIALDHGQLMSAWRRDGQVFVDSPGKPEVAVGAGKDVAIAAGSKGAYVAWTSGTAIEVLRPGAAKPTQIASDGAFVSLMTFTDGSALAAWEASGSIRIEQLKP